MDNKLANDIIEFDGNPCDGFLQAITAGQKVCSQNPGSSFSVVFDSVSGTVRLHIERIQSVQSYAELFGPGDVPGYLTEYDMQAIYSLAEKLPTDGTIVEVGSFLGKSACEWANSFKTQKKNYNIICIDSFNTNVDILRHLLEVAEFNIPSANTHLKLFEHYTKNYSNIQPIEGFFNRDFVFDHKVDLVFEDSDHTQQALSYALPFWWDKIKPGGILSGHDYWMREVRTAVDTFATINKLQVNKFNDSSIWYIEKHA